MSSDLPVYRRTQLGYVTLLTTLGGVVSVVALVALRIPTPLLVIIGAFLLISAALFSSLTISLSGDHLEHNFALGFWRKRIPIADIVSASRPTAPGWKGGESASRHAACSTTSPVPVP